MNEQEMMNELKKAIAEKTECMIGSYRAVLDKTALMFRGSVVSDIQADEIAKRADMFWNIALQKATQPQQQSMPQGMPPQNQQKSPCQKKADDKDAIIRDLQKKLAQYEEQRVIKE